jgi:putative phosphonate metabolism protein
MDDLPGGCERFAVYWAPPAGDPLARLGAAWLGRDPETGAEPAPLELGALPMPREALVREPRRYGLHATLKAPFRLAGGVDPALLGEAVAALAGRLAPVEAPALRVETEDGFVSLRPSGPAPALDALAAACVTELDLLRAPLSAPELARRRRIGLDPVEEAHLRRWGYPWVLDRFRFHVTLTGPLPAAEARRLAPLLGYAFAEALAAPLRVAEMAVFGDPGGGAPFRLLRRYPLGG